MIGCVTGTLLTSTTTSALVEANGIGYQIHVVTPPTPDETGQVQLWTYLAVRENALDLYGFADLQTKSVFEALLDIPKVGPKSALQILQKAHPELLLQAAKQNDPHGLAKRSGIGSKTAEKVVQALAEHKLLESALTATAATDPIADEVVATLVALGYKERAAADTLRYLRQQDPDLTDSKLLITQSLRHLSSHS